MKSKTDDYYFWSGGGCDTENLALWAQLQAGTFCGACQRPLIRPDTHGQVINSAIGMGRCQPCSMVAALDIIFALTSAIGKGRNQPYSSC